MMISISAVAAHLWQSTLFALVIGLATLMFRRNHAAIRHALWLTASVKFLIPFALLTALGAEFGPRLRAPIRVTEMVVVIEGGGRALTPAIPLETARIAAPAFTLPSPWILGGAWLCGVAAVLAVWWMRWRRVSAIASQGTAVEAGSVLDALRRLERAAGIGTPIRLIESDASLEPGVVGFIRPLLVWPRAIGNRLEEQQLVTILAHEVSHVRRRDNLTAAVHMAVQALFWFHPLVWWIGARLVDERERACDEAVVRLGHEPRVYAETILAACRIFLESPLPCVAGVTGSNLLTRIERIMEARTSEALTPLKKLFVAAVPVVAIVAPIVVGILDAPRVRAAGLPWFGAQGTPEFEVAAVKPNKTGSAKVMIRTQPGGRFTAENVTLRSLILFAYRLQPLQLAGGPGWLDSDRFDVLAKADVDAGDLFEAERRGEDSPVQLMLRTLLRQRFNLVVRTETRELPVYALVRARSVGKFGPGLQTSSGECAASMPSPPERTVPCGITMGRGPGTMRAGGVTMAQLARTLTNWVGRIVLDRTELPGTFDFTLGWTPDQMPQGFEMKVAAGGVAPPDPNGPSIFTALQEQLGLKLDGQKSPVDVLIVDRAEHPKEN